MRLAIINYDIYVRSLLFQGVKFGTYEESN